MARKKDITDTLGWNVDKNAELRKRADVNESLGDHQQARIDRAIADECARGAVEAWRRDNG
jgi:hypothetical protein